MKLCKFILLLLCMVAISSTYLRAEDQPAAPPMPHSTTHLTKITAALDQPGVPVSVSLMQAGSISGKRHQMLRGIFPVTQDFTLYVNGVSIKNPAPSLPATKGLEIKIAYTLKGGNYKNVFVESRYVDLEDIPTLQQFLTTMKGEALRRSDDDTDHTQGSFITPGSTTFGFARNGKKDTDYYVMNAPDTLYDFHLKSGNDVAKMQALVNDAVTWLQTH